MNTLQKIEYQIKQKGINKKIFLESMGLNKSKWGDWERGDSTTYYNIIAEIAQYFNVTTDYLLGLSDTPTQAGNELDQKQTNFTNSQLKFALFGDSEIDDDLLDDVKKLAILQMQLRNAKKDT